MKKCVQNSLVDLLLPGLMLNCLVKLLFPKLVSNMFKVSVKHPAGGPLSKTILGIADVKPYKPARLETESCPAPLR